MWFFGYREVPLQTGLNHNQHYNGLAKKCAHISVPIILSNLRCHGGLKLIVNCHNSRKKCCPKIDFFYFLLIHCFKMQGFFQIFHRNSSWIKKWFKFSNGNSVDFSISYPFITMKPQTLLQKSFSYSKKPNYAVEFFANIESKLHLEALDNIFRLNKAE